MAAASPISVLIVEDDFMVASIHRAFVERLDGFAVAAVAHTGREGLAYAEAQQPDVVLLDVYLPDLSGLQVLWEMRQRRLPSDVIFITAARDVETVREAMRGGAVYYIVKPFGFDKFSATLTEFAVRRQRLEANGALDQAEIDQVYGSVRAGSTAAELPKGLSEITLEQMVGFLGTATTPVTAEQVAVGVGVTRNTARRYLEHLMRQGKVRRHARYGTVGRPEHWYTVCRPLR